MSTWTRFVRFNAVSALGIGVQLAALWLLTTGGVNYLVATTLSVGAAVVHNFVWHRQWTWMDRRTSLEPMRTFAHFALANGAVSLVTNLVVMAALVGWVGVAPVVANLLAIATAGLINFRLSDRLVFVVGSDRGQTGVAPGSDRGQTGVRPPAAAEVV